MSLWNDFWDFVDHTVDDIGNTLQDTWDAIKHNPIGAITSAVAMAYGIPPMWAGALGGATGAAASGANGSNILKAAVTGGAMGEMGYQAADFAGAAVTPAFGATAGAIASGAAAGAAAGVTGAILTGQNVLDAAKAGLVLGTVMAGGQVTYKLMTAGEAASSVPMDAIARANSSADPIGTLAKEMGWFDSVSATNAASQSIQTAKNDGSLKQYYADQIPDEVLAKALDTGNPAQTVAQEMGWSMSGSQAGGIYDALKDYQYANTPAVETLPTNAQSMINSGLVNPAEANVLDNAGFTANDVTSLTKLGYTGQELVDMASTGVSARTLTNLAASPFSESTLDTLLTNGVSANDISNVSGYVRNGTISADTAESLLNHGVTGYHLSGMIINGQANIASELLDKGVTPQTIQQLTQNNVNLNSVNDVISSGKLNAVDLNNDAVANSSWNKNNWDTYVQHASQMPTPTVAAAPGPQPSDLAKSIANQYPMSNVSASDVQTYLDKGYSVQQISSAIYDNPGVELSQTLGTQTAGTQPVSPSENQVAVLSPENQQTVTDASNNYLSGKTSWEDASKTINQAVQNDINSGYLKPNGDGTYTSPDGTIYDYNNQTGMWDTHAGAINGQGSAVQAPVVPPTETITPTVTPTEITTPTIPVLTYTNSVSANGTTYDVNHYSDGSTVYTDISNGGTGSNATEATLNGQGTGTTTGTGAGTIPVTTTTTPVTPEVPVTPQPVTPTTPTTPETPLTPPTQEVIPPTQPIPEVQAGTGTNVPVDEIPHHDTTVDGTTTEQPYVPPIIPIVPPPTTEVPAETRGHYTLGEPIHPAIPHTLNPGWITNVPAHYQTTNPAQAQYYWGGHPYQTGTTFNPTLYNQTPNAPATPWGLGYAQTNATPQQIMSLMGLAPVAP